MGYSAKGCFENTFYWLGLQQVPRSSKVLIFPKFRPKDLAPAKYEPLRRRLSPGCSAVFDRHFRSVRMSGILGHGLSITGLVVVVSPALAFPLPCQDLQNASMALHP